MQRHLISNGFAISIIDRPTVLTNNSGGGTERR
jgi:hypothetical protein